MKNYKDKFPYFEYNPQTIYFDSGATSLKPQQVVDAARDYLIRISANPHAGDYKQAIVAQQVLVKTRKQTQQLINAQSEKEIIFTSGATFGLNLIANGVKQFLQPKDEIWITTVEHSSNLLPWIVLAEKMDLTIRQIPLTDEFAIDAEKLASLITDKAKVVTFASVTNTVGIFNDTATIAKLVKAKNPQVIVAVDATQEVGHHKIDVQKSDVDFLAFSAHKMYGPFGVGVVYGKYSLLEQIPPLVYGGGNNNDIDFPTLKYELNSIPERFESGTPNISGIFAFSKTLDFVNEIGMDNIAAHEQELKRYLVAEFNKTNLGETVHVFNLNNSGPLFGFNVDGLNPQDVAVFLSTDYNIAARSGAQCAKTTETELGFKNSVRISLGIYNTKEDIDQLILGLKNLDKVFDHLFDEKEVEEKWIEEQY